MKTLVALAGALAVASAPQSQAAPAAQGRIAFARDRGDISSIWSIRPDGSGLRQVTRPFVRQGFGGDSGPVWSRDGRRLAFSRDLPYWGADRFRIRVVGAGGHGDEAVTSGPFDVMPTWSPTRRLAFVRLEIGDEVTVSTIYTVRPGAQPEKLILGSRDVTPAWSPDGRLLAFSRLGGDHTDLYVANADGADVRAVGVEGSQPAWSPDGQRLAFVSTVDRNGATCGSGTCLPNGEIYTVRLDGSGLKRLTRSKADDAHPTWSPDGRRIAFSSGYDITTSGHAPWLMLVSAGGGPARRLTRMAGIHDPDWSPASVR